MWWTPRASMAPMGKAIARRPGLRAWSALSAVASVLAGAFGGLGDSLGINREVKPGTPSARSAGSSSTNSSGGDRRAPARMLTSTRTSDPG